MDITIPAVPLGIVTLLAFFGPYAVSVLNAILPFVNTPTQRKVLSVVFAVLLAAAVIVLYGLEAGWDALGALGIVGLIIVSVVVLSSSYALIVKPSAAALERRLER